MTLDALGTRSRRLPSHTKSNAATRRPREARPSSLSTTTEGAFADST
jgi:hypothetical protein